MVQFYDYHHSNRLVLAQSDATHVDVENYIGTRSAVFASRNNDADVFASAGNGQLLYRMPLNRNEFSLSKYGWISTPPSETSADGLGYDLFLPAKRLMPGLTGVLCARKRDILVDFVDLLVSAHGGSMTRVRVFTSGVNNANQSGGGPHNDGYMYWDQWMRGVTIGTLDTGGAPKAVFFFTPRDLPFTGPYSEPAYKIVNLDGYSYSVGSTQFWKEMRPNSGAPWNPATMFAENTSTIEVVAGAEGLGDDQRMLLYYRETWGSSQHWVAVLSWNGSSLLATASRVVPQGVSNVRTVRSVPWSTGAALTFTDIGNLVARTVLYRVDVDNAIVGDRVSGAGANLQRIGPPILPMRTHAQRLRPEVLVGVFGATASMGLMRVNSTPVQDYSGPAVELPLEPYRDTSATSSPFGKTWWALYGEYARQFDYDDSDRAITDVYGSTALTAVGAGAEDHEWFVVAHRHADDPNLYAEVYRLHVPPPPRILARILGRTVLFSPAT